MSQFERFVTDGNEKADELAKAGRQVRFWTKDLWRKREQRQSSRSEKRYMQLCSPQPVSGAWWKNGKTEELKPKPNEKWIFADKKRKRSTERSGVLRQTSIDA